MKRYHVIQKLLALCLVFSMAFVILAGCKKEEQNPAGTISDFESQAHFQPGASGDDSASGDTSKAPVSGEFVVSDKKYDYNGANLELLYVENQTDRHYNVTIKGKYLDENGETIKEESQTFEGFPAGWSNHFVFYPKVSFESFSYEIETEEYQANAITSDENGVPYVSYIELTYEKQMEWMRASAGGDENGHTIEARDMYFWSTILNNHPTVKLGVDYNVIVLDEQGEIYITDYDYYKDLGISDGVSGATIHALNSEENGKRRYQVPLKEQAPGLDETIPDNVQGVFTAIFAIKFVDDIDKYMDQFGAKG